MAFPAPIVPPFAALAPDRCLRLLLRSLQPIYKGVSSPPGDLS